MKRIAVLSILAVVAAVGATTAAAAAPAKQPVATGFYRGQTIRYYDFGPIKLAKGNAVAPIWTVRNGVAKQHNVVDTVPGRPGYTPLWQLNEVTFKAGVTPRLLTSAAQVKAAEQRGDVTVKPTSTIVNCPVLGFGQKRITGFSDGHVIHYYDDGPVKVRAGNVTAPLYAPTNGVPGQHNVALESIGVGQTLYPALWSIVSVTWQPGAHKVLLRSAAQVKAAAARGELTVKRTSLVVNCPVVP
ncbi:MAG TPA: hypothetical protein VFK17_00195 [Gaiellaceae bacterium]|nr:hypothetical protein [Gaiellaceae bacterium]